MSRIMTSLILKLMSLLVAVDDGTGRCLHAESRY